MLWFFFLEKTFSWLLKNISMYCTSFYSSSKISVVYDIWTGHFITEFCFV